MLIYKKLIAKNMEEKIVALLEHEGVQIESCLTPEEIEEISTDPDKYVTVFQRQLRANEQVQSSVNSKSSKFWTTSSVKLLLSIRLGMEDQFNSPTCKKMKLWDDISKQMIEMGINVNGNDCYSKYRNLLQTYRSNKERSMKTGEGRIQWEFFEDFDAVLGNKASTIPPANILSTSLNQTEETHRENSEELLTVLPVSERALSLPEDVSQQSKKNIKKKVELSLPQYLFYKKEKDEEKWKEKKELKLQEIAAISSVASALNALAGQNLKPNTSSSSSRGHKKRKHTDSDSD